MISTILIVIVTYILYYFISINRYDKFGHSKKKNVSDYAALPQAANYFIDKYKIDQEKINFKALLKLIALVLGIDIAIMCIPVALLIKNEILQVLIGTLVLIPLYLISLKILGKYFKKKGLVKNV